MKNKKARIEWIQAFLVIYFNRMLLAVLPFTKATS